MVADRETVDKNKELVKNKKELINLQTELADAYYECTKHRGRIGDLAPYEDDNILKESGVKNYAEARFNLNKHCLETTIDDSSMEHSHRYMDLSKTVLLALPEKAEESVDIIKNAAIKCIREKDDHFASRGMLGVASALCDIAEKRPDLTMTIRDCIDEITSADKKAQEFGPAANLRFAIKKRNMQDVLLIKKPLSPEKMMTGNLLDKVKE